MPIILAFYYCCTNYFCSMTDEELIEYLSMRNYRKHRLDRATTQHNVKNAVSPNIESIKENPVLSVAGTDYIEL
jgi:hypothetical protein